MKKRLVFVALAICIGFGAVAWAQMPGADADALWKHITKENLYTKWGFWPDHQGMQPGRAPHGPLHKVYVNSPGLKSARPPVQYGTIAVKENYTKDKKLAAITVMYKLKGYNPGDGDWVWAKFTPQGKAAKFGKPAGCIGCHGTRSANDFILVHEFK